MKLEQLKQVITIAQAGSFNKAAVELYVTQSNLSQSIKLLEDEIGYKIFERTGKGVVLTSFGSEFLNHAKATYNQFLLTGQFCKTFHHNPTLTLSISSQYLRFANFLFIQLCQKYQNNNIEFAYLENSFVQIIEDVIHNQSEVGVIVISNAQKKTTLNLIKARGLTYTSLKKCKPVVKIGKHHPIYDTDTTKVTLDQLQNDPIVMFRDTTFNFAAELINNEYYQSKNRILVSDRNAMNEILLNTNAYTIAVETDTYKEFDYYDNIKMLELSDAKITFELGWVKRSENPLSELALEYIELLDKLFL